MIKDLLCTDISVRFEEGKLIKDERLRVVLGKEPNHFKIELNFLDPVCKTTQEEIMNELRKIFKFNYE